MSIFLNTYEHRTDILDAGSKFPAILHLGHHCVIDHLLCCVDTEMSRPMDTANGMQNFKIVCFNTNLPRSIF